ncbi:MAG TPA: hypothetical protein VGG29_03905 [Caulobacteraceae bacterium]|jgi:hypothetical protein
MTTAIAIGRPAAPGLSGGVAGSLLGALGLRGLVRGGLIMMATAFCNGGAGIITNRVIQAGTQPKWLGWGTGTNAAAVTDAALQTEAAPTTGGGRTAATESRTTVTNANDNLQYQGAIIATAGLSITEAGAFDAATAGNLLLRSVFGVVTVAINDAVQLTFGLKFVPSVT